MRALSDPQPEVQRRRAASQAELREHLQGVLDTEAVPAAPDVFYVFKDAELAQRYFAARYRRRGATPRQRINERRFEEHRPLLEPRMAKITPSCARVSRPRTGADR